MSARTWVVAGSLFTMAGLNVYLLWEEEQNYFSKLQTTAEGRVLAKASDPLLNIRYTEAKRESNLEAFGLDEDLVSDTATRIRDYDDRYRTRIEFLFENAGDREALEDALCGQAGVRPRYGALRYLIEAQKDGSRTPINLQRATTLEWQDWSKGAPIGAVYSEVELVEDRQPDATLMGVAAILTARERDVLERNSPWGPGLAQRWSWTTVMEEEAGIRDKVVKYFAAMHLVVEMATAEGGVCGGF
ncbi:MAG: hypothetical protein GY913_31055 [Proteobacteria bacterium]|nr:hypothetical protein [Pseudomonadota bacterium]MCP4921357.1 hypothetical protein [Pseudomonadota bacterium]